MRKRLRKRQFNSELIGARLVSRVIEFVVPVFSRFDAPSGIAPHTKSGVGFPCFSCFTALSYPIRLVLFDSVIDNREFVQGPASLACVLSNPLVRRVG